MARDKKSIKTQEYDEFSKISLHTHFGGVDQKLDKKYGFKKPKFDYEDVVSKLVSAKANNFDLLGMTNSNVILPLEFILSKELASLIDIELICGAEICIKNENKDMYLHTVVLFPDNIDIVKLTLLLEEKF